jgi:hypothetical protein
MKKNRTLFHLVGILILTAALNVVVPVVRAGAGTR